MRLAPRLKSSDAQLLLRDSYETTFGIYNHEVDDPARPMALMAMHPAEDSSTGSLLYERIEQFGEKQVPKWYGLSLKDFLSLPTDICIKILQECEKLRNKESTDTSNLISQLGSK